MSAYSTRSLADRWDCSQQHIRDMIENGDLQCFRLGRLIRVSKQEVERFEQTGGSSYTEDNTLPLHQSTARPFVVPYQPTTGERQSEGLTTS